LGGRRAGFATIAADVQVVPNARRRFEMSTLKKNLKLAGALAIVLGVASPLMATSASAAPYHGHTAYSHNDRDHGRYDWQRDRRHTPKARYERRPPMPHHGHYKWREGRWNWSHSHWVWAPGIWIRF
jgi:hypothetical protein